jgi:hypothetical protein
VHSARHGRLSAPGAGVFAITHKNHINISMLSATSIMTDFLGNNLFIFSHLRAGQAPVFLFLKPWKAAHRHLRQNVCPACLFDQYRLL